MVKTKLVKSAGRFGARYGRRIKRKIADIESKQRQRQICPFCGKKAKRLSKGVWKCKKCKMTFAGHAYYLEKGAITVKTKKPELKQEAEIKPAKKTKTPRTKSSKSTKLASTKKTTAKSK